MFLLNLMNGGAMCLKTCASDLSQIWCMRFGRLNFGGLQALGEKKTVKGTTKINQFEFWNTQSFGRKEDGEGNSNN